MLRFRQTRRAALVATILLSPATPCAAQSVKGLHAYLRRDVDRPAASKPGIGMPPRYPDNMRRDNRDGVVRVRFVVDRQGVPQLSTFQVTQSDDSSFSVAVQQAVSTWRFTPARRKGSRVAQLMELGFYFELADQPRRRLDEKTIDVVITASPAGPALPNH